MYKVVLIDDEEWILKALEALIDWEQLGFRIAGKAQSAIQAEFIIKQYSPDIVISDIRMPGMSGLDLLENFKRKKINILTIFFSAYDDFSYAQKAISLGAFDYLLKPVGAEALHKTLLRARESLNEIKATNRTLERFRNTGVIYELLEHGGAHNRIMRTLAENGVRIRGTQFRVFCIKGSEKTNNSDIDVIEDILSDSADKSGISFLHALIGNKKWMYLVNYKTDSKAENLELYKKISDFIRSRGICIGVSMPFSSLEQIKAAYMQADLIEYYKMIKFNKTICNFKMPDTKSFEIFQNEVVTTDCPEKLELLIKQIPAVLRKVKSGPDMAAAIFNKVIKKISSLSGINLEDDYIMDNSVIEEYSSIEQLTDILIEKLLISVKTPVNRSVNNAIIKDILSEIEANYSQKLMIGTMAEKYHINISYLSDLFKRETGKPFTSYLVEYRMNKAVELLSDDRLTIYEISEKVGYDDYFHFNKLFKKYKNITPAAYRKR